MATFKEAFAKARKELGPGETFKWNGKTYTTNYKGEEKDELQTSPRPKPRSKGVATRPKARPDRAPKSSTRPKARPVSGAPKTSPRPKDATWPRVTNNINRRRAERGEPPLATRNAPRTSPRPKDATDARIRKSTRRERQTVGDNLRSIPETIDRAIDNIFRKQDIPTRRPNTNWTPRRWK